MAKADKAPATGQSRTLMVQSVEKAFNILNAFDSDRPTLGLTQIATALGIDKSTAQRFTYTLEALGYLKKDPETKRFELTVKTLSHGSRYLRSNRLVQNAAPFLSHLNKVTDETVNLVILDGADVVYIARYVSRHIFRTDVVLGSRLPAFCTASGIAILSRLDPAEARRILEASDLRQYTPSTTYRMDDLVKKIADTRQRGYSTAFEEYYPDDLSFGAAVMDSRGAPAGAITIAVSRARYTPEAAEELFAKQVVAAASAITV